MIRSVLVLTPAPEREGAVLEVYRQEDILQYSLDHRAGSSPPIRRATIARSSHDIPTPV